jgi:hypothetical protein
VTDRHWRRLAKQVEAARDRENRPRHPAPELEKADTTGGPKGVAHPSETDITGRPPPGGFEDVSDFDRWLHANGYDEAGEETKP